MSRVPLKNNHNPRTRLDGKQIHKSQAAPPLREAGPRRRALPQTRKLDWEGRERGTAGGGRHGCLARPARRRRSRAAEAGEQQHERATQRQQSALRSGCRHGAGEPVAGSCCSSEVFRNAQRIYREENQANKSYWGREQEAGRAEGGEPPGGRKRGTATGIGAWASLGRWRGTRERPAWRRREVCARTGPARRGVAVARRNGARRENDEDREHASAPATDQTWKRVRRPVSSDFQFWATKVSLTESVCVGGGGLDRDPGPKRHQNPRPGSHQLGAVGAVTP